MPVCKRQSSALPVLTYQSVRSAPVLADHRFRLGLTKKPDCEIGAQYLNNHRVTLGLDPRALYLPYVPQVQCPRVKPEGDVRWVGQRQSRKISELPSMKSSKRTVVPSVSVMTKAIWPGPVRRRMGTLGWSTLQE
jgi:hypothetical protein